VRMEGGFGADGGRFRCGWRADPGPIRRVGMAPVVPVGMAPVVPVRVVPVRAVPAQIYAAVCHRRFSEHFPE
jgi:hypothetical protein